MVQEVSSLRRASVCLLSKRAGRVGASGTDFHTESLPPAGPKFLAQCSGPTKPDSDSRSQFYRKAFVRVLFLTTEPKSDMKT